MSNKLQKKSNRSGSIGTAFLRILLNMVLLVLVKLYFLVPDLINRLRKYSFKKKEVANNIRITRSEEKIPAFSELK